MTIAAGTRLGPYEVVAPLGAGGMGEVWRGRDTRLDRSVAIKVVSPEFAKRFDREAKSISALNHPHICTLYDVGPNYLVMELLEGESLAERLAKGPLPLEQVLRYGTQIADALDKAHRQRIIHRDLKPGNVMITKSGAKLLDFGLAKADVAPPPSAAVTGEGAGPTAQKPLTEEGTIVGTFQYMAPEQLEGLAADARTDIFAFGAVLYEMATGRRAFEGKTKTSLIAAIVGSEPAPMSQIQPLTPPAFEHVVRKCLAKDPDDRWQSAHDIAEELKWISEAGSQAGVAAPLLARKRSRERLVWAAAIVVALIAGAFIARRRWQQPAPQYRFAVPMIDADYKFGFNPALAPDGRTLFFQATNADGKIQVFRRRLDDLSVTAISGTENSSGLGFVITPDGRNLILIYPGAVIKRISIDGGPMQTLADGLEGGFEPSSGAAVAPDGTILVGGGNGIRRLLPGGAIQWIVKGVEGETFSFPIFLPDAKRYLFVSGTHDARGVVHRVLCAGALGSSEITRIGEVPTRVEYARGHLFYVREGTLMAQPFDISALKFTGEALAVADNMSFGSRYGTGAFSVAPDGTIAALAAPSGYHLEWVDGAGKKIGAIGGSAQILGFALVPDSDRLVLSINDHRTGFASLWLREFTREAATRLTFSAATETLPVVTRDGDRVFFTSDLRLNEVPIDGSAPPKGVVPSSAGVQRASSASADGRFLMYSSNEHQRETKLDLWVLPLIGGGKPFPYLATPAAETQGVFSPDVKWVAYVSDPSTPTGSGQVFVRPFPGPGASRPASTGSGRAPRFSLDGKKIYFVDGSKLMAADFQNGVVREAVILFQLDESIQQFEPMPDNRFLMLLYKDADASPPVRVITNWQPPAK